MEPFKSILIDVDSEAGVHPALERGVRLARKCGARITLTDVLTVPTSARRSLPAGVEEEIVNARRQALAKLGQTITGVEVETKLLFGRPATVLIQEVLRSGNDLLMRSHARDAVKRPFGAIDMELIRKCPCPVLLVSHGPVPTNPKIVAAVNSSTDEPEEMAFNRKLVETALYLASVESGTPIVLQAWTPFAEMTVRANSTEEAFAAYVDAARQQVADDMLRLTRSFGDRLKGVEVTLQRGPAEEVIPTFVVSQGVDLVVIGTVARAGIAGLLVGNTAERVLGHLPCSVLAVKPDGFVSPIRLES